MKNITLKYGLITCVILAIALNIHWSQLAGDTTYGASEFLGYISIIVALSSIFFAVRKQRAVLGGSIGFWPAFLTGLYISLMATVVYVVSWMIVSHNNPELIDHIFDMMINSPDLSPEKVEEYKEIKVKYASDAFYRAMVTVTEILPVGLAVSLITSFILSSLFKKKKELDAKA